MVNLYVLPSSDT